MRRQSPIRTAARSSVLILGAGRSGTTMIASLLGAHTDLGIVSEDLRLVFTRISGKPVVGNKLTIPGQIQFDARSTLPKRFLRGVLGPVIGSRRVLSIGWLMPESHHSVEDYLILPDLHVVGVLRDHEPVIRSMIARARVSPGSAIRRWESAVLTLDRLSADPRFTVAFVDYDRVVADPELAARALCEFLGVAFEPGMVEGARFNPIYPGRVAISRPEPHPVTGRLPTPQPAALEAYQRLLGRCLT